MEIYWKKYKKIQNHQIQPLGDLGHTFQWRGIVRQLMFDTCSTQEQFQANVMRTIVDMLTTCCALVGLALLGNIFHTMPPLSGVVNSSARQQYPGGMQGVGKLDSMINKPRHTQGLEKKRSSTLTL